MRFRRCWICMLLLPLVGLAENWPQWRRPTLNGVSGERNLPVRWSTTENVAWKLAGDDSDFNGTPAIVGHQLFLRSSRFLYCIEAGAGG